MYKFGDYVYYKGEKGIVIDVSISKVFVGFRGDEDNQVGPDALWLDMFEVSKNPHTFSSKVWVRLSESDKWKPAVCVNDGGVVVIGGKEIVVPFETSFVKDEKVWLLAVDTSKNLTE